MISIALVRPLLLLVLLTPGLLPIIAPYLPFQDWPGHVGVIGGLVHLPNPAIGLEADYFARGWAGPNRLFYLLAYLGTFLGLSPLAASNLVLSLGLAAIGPAAYYLIRRINGTPEAAILVLPIALGRLLYCGFGPNVMALAPMMVVLGGYLGAAKSPSRRDVIIVVTALFATLGLHAFVYCAAVGFLVGLALLDLTTEYRPRAMVSGIAIAVSAAGWLAFGFTNKPQIPGQRSAFEAIVEALRWPTLSTLLEEAWGWLFASYRYMWIDDLLQAIWLLAIIGMVGVALHGAKKGTHRPVVTRLLVLSAGSLCAFSFIPAQIGAPVNWWGGNLRVPGIEALVLVALASLGSDALKGILLRVGILTSVVVVVVFTADVKSYSDWEMGGIETVISTIPAGSKLCTLHYSPSRIHEYPGEPHRYVGNYYLARQGGWLSQNLFGNPGEPIGRRTTPKVSGNGNGNGFRWNQHAAGCESFLVRASDENPELPFVGGLRKRVRLVSSHGRWRHYRKQSL